MEYTKEDIQRIVSHLKQYKHRLSKIYNWSINFEKLIELKVFSSSEVENIIRKNNFEQAIELRNRVELKLSEFLKHSKEDFYNLSHWIIKDWGGINASRTSNLELIKNYLDQGIIKFERIASLSKVLSFLNPQDYIIYDSRVAYSLNWILLSNHIKNKYFPLPSGRNPKISAFDINVLIRLNNIKEYAVNEEETFKERLFLNNIENKFFFTKAEAYSELNKLVKRISEELWKENKQENLYYTEMLLFAIADNEIYKEITNSVHLNIRERGYEVHYDDETPEQKLVAEWNCIIQLRNLNYSDKRIAEHMSTTIEKLKDIEARYKKFFA
ncbi:MAG: hypothetical protein ACR2MS_00380 [Weeksellaceae bacterium]